MNYELLKKISKNVYINFQTLRNNIKNQDLNINATFRMTAEELMKQINNKHQFVKEGESFYNRIINNSDFLLHMLNVYGFSRKEMSCLNNIQKQGNDTTHNMSKIFDIQTVKENYYRLLLISQKILQKEYKNYDFTISKTDIMTEIDNLLENIEKQEVQTTSKDDFYNKLENYNQELQMNIKNIKEINEITLEPLINKYKELISIIIKYIIENINNISSIEDLKIGPYNELYKIYYKIDNLLKYEELDEIISNLYDYTLIIKNILENRFNIIIFKDLLEIIVQEPNKEITEENNDYIEIAKAIDEVYYHEEIINFIENTVYYIEKQKSFISNGNKYYEIELRKAISDNAKNKLVYSKTKLKDNYAMELSLTNKNIKLLDNNTQIYVITSYKTAIRPCEIRNLIEVITGKKTPTIQKTGKFYRTLMNYIELNNCTLLDIATSNNQIFNDFEKQFKDITIPSCILFIKAIKKARKIIFEDKLESGANLLRYFLSNLNNTILKDQINHNWHIGMDSDNDDDKLLFSKASLQFDRNPFSYSLYRHTVNMKKLKKCFDLSEYEDDIYVRNIKNKMVEEQTLFIPFEPNEKDKITNIINNYNRHLHNDEGIKIIDNYLYVDKDVETMKNIINIIQKNSNTKTNNDYQLKMYDFLSKEELDSEEKKYVLKNAFQNTKLCFIYGEAGSGKTELLCNYFTKIFSDQNIIYISNTHSCLNNMKRRVKEKCDLKDNFEFKTIKSYNALYKRKYNQKYEIKRQYDILIIDECKSNANEEIYTLLSNIEFKYAIFAGDVGQIDAISLGNWYDTIKNLITPNNIYELKTNYRSNEKRIIDLWNKVRHHEEDTWDYMNNFNFIEKINSNIFEKDTDSQIILCLNYGGTYGITSINSYFQNKNENKVYVNNIDTYKVDDPVIFNDNANKRYNNILYNNLKGKIRSIEEDEEKLYFIINVETYIKREDLNCVITSNEAENWSNVKIELRKYKDNPDDEFDEEYKCPFDVTYALSIHKAQGLQFESVKIVITPESEEKINNEIFYTAITRSTKNLKIYLTESRQQEIINILSKKDDKVDSELLKILINE